ncbi:MAG: hypothetical protein M1834_000880 [Cirrosporium novae-zelandiae]|nr:MAG: hypothetical protein M1834_000880 [Cirrosporium novae-zelandiae]
MSSPQSLEHASPDEMEGDTTAATDAQWEGQASQDHTEQTSPQSSTVSPAQPSKPSVPLPKRRRVTRACDECRRKKIKCDGKQPCTHCTVYSYDCTYDQPSNRRRNPPPQYIEALENRVQRAEALLKTVLPDVDLDDPKYEAGLPQRMHMPVRKPSEPISTESTPNTDDKSNNANDLETDPRLDSMIESTGTLELDDRGNWDFHGHSSGIVFLRRLHDQFGNIFGRELQGLPLMPSTKSGISPSTSDSPLVGQSPTDSNLLNLQDLPNKACARQLCENALEIACASMRFIHQPSFYNTFDRIYDIPVENYGNEENKFLPLLYSVLAVGCLFSQKEQASLGDKIYEDAINQGFKYFRVSRNMMDICDCRDIPSLQTILFMVFFLQSSAKLSTCYSYIGVAMRAALRMGLHRSLSVQFDPIERETRKRTFWTIRKMDIYVSALLGLPRMLNDEDIDQELPAEVDDEYITHEKALPMPPGTVSLVAATNAQIRLVSILQKVMKHIYPIKSIGHNSQGKPSSQSYSVSHSKIREVELDLQNWTESLPMVLRPGDDSPPQFKRVQQLLRMSYAHVQMMLYRPFLHYASHACAKGDKRSFPCAAACVSVSRNIVHISLEMKKRGLLIGAYWFAMYTTFFAILSLVFYIVENPGKTSSQEIWKDAQDGRATLADLSERSMAADRCTKFLDNVFAELPEKLRRSRRTSSVSAKKRRAGPSPHPVPTATRSTPEVSRNSTPDVGAVQRSSTFPRHVAANAMKRSSAPVDISSLRRNLQLDAHSRQGSQDVFIPRDNSAGTPDSSASSLSFKSQIGTQQQSLLYQQQLANNIPDLTPMMFPSSDPFAYPNQPITTLENQPNFDEGFYLPESATSTTQAYDSNMDTQSFGQINNFMMPTQQAPPYPQTNYQSPTTNGPPNDTNNRSNSMMGQSMANLPGWWSQTQNHSGMESGLDELFNGSEDWHSRWMNLNFQP